MSSHSLRLAIARYGSAHYPVVDLHGMVAGPHEAWQGLEAVACDG